jgi:hypothetical protein
MAVVGCSKIWSLGIVGKGGAQTAPLLSNHRIFRLGSLLILVRILNHRIFLPPHLLIPSFMNLGSSVGLISQVVFAYDIQNLPIIS